MPRIFVAEAADPERAFLSLKQWADGSGYLLTGDATGGRFRGTPEGLAGVLIGEISGAYEVRGKSVTIQVNKDLPEAAVANALAKFGLRFRRSA